MKESGFWRKLRPLMKEAAPGIVVERIESWSTPSFPDVSATWGSDFWLELKIIRNSRVKMRPGQVRWLQNRWSAGSQCFVLAYEPKRKDIYLFKGQNVRRLTKETIWEVPHYSGSLNAKDIRTLLEVICGPEV